MIFAADAGAYGGGPRPVSPSDPVARHRLGGVLSLLTTPTYAQATVVRLRARGGLSMAASRARLKRFLPRIRRCAAKNIRGVLAARLHVAPGGRATLTRLPRTTLHNPLVARCVGRVLRGPWPRRSQSTNIELVLRLKGPGSMGVLGGIVGGRAHGIARSPRAVVSVPLVGKGPYLSHVGVRRVIQRHIKQIKGCYERALVFRADLKGKIVVVITINAGGNVANARVRSSTIDKAGGVGPCVLKRIRTWSFPPPKGRSSVVIIYPFIFRKK